VTTAELRPLAGGPPWLVIQLLERCNLWCNTIEEFFLELFSQPHTLESETIAAYLSADWTAIADHHQRCAVPWMYAKISAPGDVTTRHSFYDITVGNIYDRSLIDRTTARRRNDS
jgi:MoaA/NifB/PqqE/SkfB family radical SAM enzyme